MRPRNILTLAAITVVASAVLATACTDPSPPSPLEVTPAARTHRLAASTAGSVTVWDFVTLAGGVGPQGNPATFTMSGGGSIVASVLESQPNPGFQVYAKIYGQDVATTDPYAYERGLGICGDYGAGGACIAGDDEEVGDAFWDASGNKTLFPSLLLDFTGLASGSVVDSVTLSSLQTGSSYSIYSSSDGTNFSLMASGTASSTTTDNLTLPVPAGVLYLRFDVGPGGANNNNYLVQSVTVTTGTTPPPPPPPGKTFSIGPSSMEGAILISNGDWVNGGYSFKFDNGTHIATNFFVHATVSITGPCIGGGPSSDTFTFALNDGNYAVPANNTDWLPTGDANSVLSWQGSVRASGVCGGVGKLDARHGAVFTATVSQNPPTGSLVDFRFKYRDPAAKGKPNTNCLDTSDPNRARADVCGASWSQTVRDP